MYKRVKNHTNAVAVVIGLWISRCKVCPEQLDPTFSIVMTRLGNVIALSLMGRTWKDRRHM